MPFFLTPGGSAASTSTPPPIAPLTLWPQLLRHPPTSRLISTRLPTVTGPTLKSHQSPLLQQEPRHQQDSFFCLNGTMEAESSFVVGLTPTHKPRWWEKVTVNLFRTGATSSRSDPCERWILTQLADVTERTGSSRLTCRQFSNISGWKVQVNRRHGPYERLYSSANYNYSKTHKAFGEASHERTRGVDQGEGEEGRSAAATFGNHNPTMRW